MKKKTKYVSITSSYTASAFVEGFLQGVRASMSMVGCKLKCVSLVRRLRMQSFPYRIERIFPQGLQHKLSSPYSPLLMVHDSNIFILS